MALFPLGILSAAGAGGGAVGDYELIETQILGGSQATISFNNLNNFSSVYRHLQIRLIARDSGSTNGPGGIWLRFNSDNGSNYAWHRFYGGTPVADNAVSTTRMLTGVLPANGATGNVYGPNIVDILDVYSAKNKTVRGFSFANTPVSNTLQFGSGLWFSTASVTSMQITTDNSFMAGSRFSLYGIRG